MKAILADPEQPRRIDHEAVYHYLSFLTAPAPMTFFADVQKLEPGSWLRIDESGAIERRTLVGPVGSCRPADRRLRRRSSRLGCSTSCAPRSSCGR